MAPNRASSPAARERKASEETEQKLQDADAKDKQAGSSEKFVAPPRPAGLRGSVVTLYIALLASVALFAFLGEQMVHPVPEGKFEKKDGTLVDLSEYDPSDLGPFPKCHPHFEEHEFVAENGTRIWRKNSQAPSGGPYPVGHPENPEWIAKSNEEARKENEENRFRWAGLQPNLHLLALATLCVYLGSKHSVWIFTEPAETREAAQLLQKEDAYWFPVMGSCVLFGLFLVLKYLGTDFVKTALTAGILFMCMFGVGTNLDQLIAVVRYKPMKPLFSIPFFDQTMNLMELLGMCIGAAMAYGFMMSKNWIINNLFGVSFCLVGIKMISLSSYKTGAIMLVGLFFYDVFWVFGSKSVFGSNVMVSVAKGVEAPIKLMFPRALGGCGKLAHSMLGLGDIVVPGIFIAFLAKWDAVKIGEGKSKSFVYLNTTMVAYVLSLITTVSIMLFFNAAQPALLYIVPYVLVASLAVAVCRGELKELWNYFISEEDESGTTTDEKNAENKNK
eukprot:TRINITY_DN7698_c1_g3_i1.p1 TRINITY_DN7698_c1_g3~~TRINITY_DN7698_c1_g3_i1.p1  ORF type:complete len:529 (+),score=94.51 TRINITY_DN7698_c1_g3_i1:84-1589(+)